MFSFLKSHWEKRMETKFNQLEKDLTAMVKQASERLEREFNEWQEAWTKHAADLHKAAAELGQNSDVQAARDTINRIADKMDSQAQAFATGRQAAATGGQPADLDPNNDLAGSAHDPNTPRT